MIENLVLIFRAAWHVLALAAGAVVAAWPLLAAWLLLSLVFAAFWSIGKHRSARFVTEWPRRAS